MRNKKADLKDDFIKEVAGSGGYQGESDVQNLDWRHFSSSRLAQSLLDYEDSASFHDGLEEALTRIEEPEYQDLLDQMFEDESLEEEVLTEAAGAYAAAYFKTFTEYFLSPTFFRSGNSALNQLGLDIENIFEDALDHFLTKHVKANINRAMEKVLSEATPPIDRRTTNLTILLRDIYDDVKDVLKAGLDQEFQGMSSRIVQTALGQAKESDLYNAFIQINPPIKQDYLLEVEHAAEDAFKEWFQEEDFWEFWDFWGNHTLNSEMTQYLIDVEGF